MDYVIEKFESNECRMRYIRFGNGNKNLIVIPGLNVKSIISMAEIIVSGNRIFSDSGYTVFVFDRKENATYPYSIEHMAKDSLEVIKALGLKNLYLYGHSQGGMIAQSMVLQAPSLFNKAVFSSTVSHLNRNSIKVFTDWIGFAQNHDVFGLYDNFEKTIFSEAFAEIAHKAMVEEAKAVTDEELSRFIPNTENMFEFDVTEQLSNISTETFVVGSKADRVFDYELIKELAEKLPYGKSFFFENVGHSPAFETSEYNQRIVEFLNS